jgi:hypothetical protein
MLKKVYSLLLLTLLISCSDSDIYKTKSDEYASKPGNFIAKFPDEPVKNVIENNIGSEKFETTIFATSLGPNKFFSVTYDDLPTNLIGLTTDEELYDRMIENVLFRLKDAFKVEHKKEITQHGLKGVFYILEFKDKSLRNQGYISMKLFRNKNLFYNISYNGKNDKSIDPFMNSFRLIKSN